MKAEIVVFGINFILKMFIEINLYKNSKFVL
jgi:hypothetical protein